MANEDLTPRRMLKTAIRDYKNFKLDFFKLKSYSIKVQNTY